MGKLGTCKELEVRNIMPSKCRTSNVFNPMDIFAARIESGLSFLKSTKNTDFSYRKIGDGDR